MIKKSDDILEPKLEKLLYTDKELRQMLGVTARKLAWYRKTGIISFIATNPIRYTAKMIQDFIEYANKYPEALIRRNGQ